MFKIPENLDTAIAAPMLCAGLTTYSPLVRLGCSPGKKVGIVGIGGLGHFALMWAHALGAEVFAISHTKDKEEDAKKLGADHFIYSGDKDWAKPYAFKFDFILNCKSTISILVMRNQILITIRLRHDTRVRHVYIPWYPKGHGSLPQRRAS